MHVPQATRRVRRAPAVVSGPMAAPREGEGDRGKTKKPTEVGFLSERFRRLFGCAGKI